ncbi:MAG: serine/threonine-protein kinase [Planctomycetaceae bacterium]
MSNDLSDTLVQSDLQREQSRELSLRADRPPLSIKGYTFVRRLGTGAYGSVWLAREDNTGKNVAIKFYTHRRGLDWSLLNREVEKLAVLYTSRNIVGLLDVGWNSDPPYYVMEYLENGSLASWLEDGTLSVDESVRVATGIAKGLVHAHGSGILHCDLKPANVLFDGEKEPRLCDFGQSRLSHEQNPALGTLFFTAPEQADLRAIPDARWDVYALGALLYQMLTGAPPYRTPASEETIRSAPSLNERLQAYRNLIETSPTPEAHRAAGANVDSRLADIIDRCLSTDPQNRFPNAQAVLEQLESRERQKQRAPLLRLGVLGPLLLLAAMAPLFIYIMSRNVRTLEIELTERALESDMLTARVKAQSLEDELNRRVAEFEDMLANPALIELLEAWLPRIESLETRELIELMDLPRDEAPAWIQALDSSYYRVRDRSKLKKGGEDASWFMNSTSGRQIYRRGKGNSQNSLGKHYWSRDYFHGGEKDLPHDTDRMQPRDPAKTKMFVDEYHVSVPFLSTATNRYMIAVTVKIRGKANKDGERPVIGLLGRTIHLDDFRGRFIERIQNAKSSQGQIDREIALVDRRNWQLLDHSWIADVAQLADRSDAGSETTQNELDDEVKQLWANKSAFYEKLQLSADVIKQFEAIEKDADGHIELRLPNAAQDYRNYYTDPVGEIDSPSTKQYRDNWFAALYQVEVGRAPWVVIIQERADNTRESVDRMSAAAIRYGLLAILTSIIGLLAVWWFVMRTMRNTNK